MSSSKDHSRVTKAQYDQYDQDRQQICKYLFPVVAGTPATGLLASAVGVPLYLRHIAMKQKDPEEYLSRQARNPLVWTAILGSLVGTSIGTIDVMKAYYDMCYDRH